MNTKLPLIAILSMCSSLALANNLINPEAQGSWSGYPNVIEQHASHVGEIMLDSNGAGLSGTLSYTINEGDGAGYTFTIDVLDRTCNITGTDANGYLDGNGYGPNVYEVSTQSSIEGGTLTCGVNIDFVRKNPNYEAQLALEHYQYFYVGQDVCGSASSKYVSAYQGLPFTIKNDNKTIDYFFAVTISPGANCSSDADGVAVYKWDKTAKQFKVFDFIKQPGALFLEFIENDIQNHGKYLIVGDLGQVVLWKFNDTKFEKETQSIIKDASGIISDLELFRSGDKYFLLTTSMHIDTNQAATRLYEWDDLNSKFRTDTAQKIKTKHAASATHFNIDGNDHVAIAQLTTSTSPIYKVDITNEVEPLQILQDNVNTYGAKHWEHFKIDTTDYLIVANTAAASAVRKWNAQLGQLDDHGDKITVEDINKWKHLEVEGEHYFLSASLYNPTEIYYWCSEEAMSANHWCKDLDNPDGNRNLRLVSDNGVETPNMEASVIRTTEWHTMEIEDKLFLFRVDDSGTTKGEGVQVFEVAIK